MLTRALVVGLIAGCSAEPAPAPPSPPVRVAAPVGSTAPRAADPVLPLAAPESARATTAVVARALFGGAVPACANVRCLLDVGYASDPAAQRLVLDLFDRFGTVLMPGEGETMAMSYRGTITVVPVLPVHGLRKHLEWLHAAFDAIAATLRASDRPSAIRFPAVVGFVRSLHGKHTPSGYALDWRYTYNVEGSLNVSEDSVRSVAIHEMFHLVDGDWSEATFGADVRAIVTRCGQKQACLSPFAPTRLRVRGGTFYAFQPGNDIVAEYAAELATRVLDEQRAQLGAGLKLAPFKCGPAPNAKTWQAMVDTYFGGVDRVPSCAP